MKNFFYYFFLINIIISGNIFAQTLAPTPYYDMTSWDSSPYQSYKITGGTANPYYDMTFRLLFPKNYDASLVSTTKYPIILMLHGAGESALGGGGPSWPAYPAGDPRRFNNDHQLLHLGSQFLDARNNGTWPGFVLFPQNPNGFWTGQNWFLEEVREILDVLLNTYKVDPNRIYICGLSAGAHGVWDAIARYPRYFATADPFSGIGLPTADNTTKVAHLPIWYFQGGMDTSPAPYTANQTIQALKNVGGDPVYTIYPTLGHGTWNTAVQEKDFYPFMLRHTKLSIHVYYGKTDFATDESINVKLGISPGFSGYEWRKNGLLIDGATSNEITATSVGIYNVRFRRGAVWTPWSDPVELKYKLINTPPSITTQPASITVVTGGTATFSASAIGSSPLSYQWQKNGVNISGATSNIYSISNVVSSNAGSYRVIVSNPYGTATSNSATLTVTSRPSITTQPSSITVSTGQNISFNVAATGTSPLSYQWQKNGINIPATNSSTYALANVQPSDAGAYTVIVSNPYGSATSNPAILTVASSGGNGLNYSYYEGTWTMLPDFDALTPIKSGTTSTLDLSLRNRDNLFGFKFTGYLDAPISTNYTLYLKSDDGAKLYIDNALIINNDGNHGAWERSAVVALSAGRHALKVIYFDKEYDQILTLSWARTGVAKQEIPSSAYFLENTALRLAIPEEAVAEGITVYPNPSANIIHMKGIKAVGGVEIAIINSLGKVVKSGKITGYGEEIQTDINDLPSGSYTLRIKTGSTIQYKPILVRK